MKNIKKCVAGMLSGIMVLSAFGCGESTANAMTIDGYEVKAGIFQYYCINAYYDAVQVLNEDGFDFSSIETTKQMKKELKDLQIDGVSTKEWIQNKATEYCIQFVTIERKFDELELTLSATQQGNMESYAASSWESLGEYYLSEGIGEESMKDITMSDYKRDAIYQAYYGEDGSEGIEEDELKEYYIDNNARVKYVKMDLKDGEGNLLKADGKEVIRDMAEDYKDRLDACEDEDAMLDEFDKVIDEYHAYVTSISEAAVTTTTTTAATTEAPIATETDADGSVITVSATTPAATTTVTTATLAPGETAATTTTTAKFANESVIAKMTTTTPPEEKPESNASGTTTTTTAPTYTPSEKTYNYIYNDAKVGTPEIIEEDEAIYLIVRLDIEDRMTSDDLWNTNAIEDARYALYGDTFTKMVEEWTKAYTEERNERAYKRYNPLNLDIMEYTKLMQQMYYNSYSGS